MDKTFQKPFTHCCQRAYFMVPEKRTDNQAKRIEVHVDQYHFFVVKHQNQLFIPTNEGLRLIGVNIDWISELGSKRRAVLKRRGFSFEEKLLCYQIQSDGGNNWFFASSYSLSDWMAIWSYFASRRNFKAVRLLKYLAQKAWEDFV
ncbi:MAG TPA: hypothetical protein V6C95_22195 [Coleofasciculaceae cyanobacterium]